MIKIGIIGCGCITQVRHAPEYAMNPDCCLVGFYDLMPDKAKELARQYNAKAYSSIREMLDDSSIDAVSVCTANTTHADITIRALNAGKHVLCEKPMATTAEEAEKMIEAANS